jgi:hypothetical protein
MNSDPNCLEGPGRTPEELAENFRELNKVAPTAAEKLMLMTGNLRPTPRTDAEEARMRDAGCPGIVTAGFCQRIERELAEALEQRDGLLEALKRIARNPGDCDWETGFFSGHIARAAIAAVEGGT